MYCKKFIVSRLILLVGTFFWACSSESTSGGNEPFEGSINGVSQKGPFLEGSSVVMQELEGKTLAQTGKSFRGKVINDRGDFSIENIALDYPYVLLEVNGYYRNEVTGKKSKGSIFMKAIADVSGQSKVNINLLTHLEYERVQTLVEQNNMSIEEAKRQADREIFAAFYADVDYDKVEHLSIFGNGDGDAALLAINVLLLGNESEADFMARFATMGQDFAADGVWNDSLLKIKIADFACEASRSGKLAEIRQNIESWKIADVPPFETYVNRFWVNQYGLGECNTSNLGMRKLFVDGTESSVFRDSAFKCTENGWAPYSNNEVYSKSVEDECTAENEGEVKVVWVGNPKYGYDTYNRCESGLWVRGNISLTCDTTGVQVGDLCRKTGTINIFQAGMNATLPEYVFVYAGNGIWEDFDGLAKMTKQCTAENEDDMEKIVYGRGDNTLTVFYKCTGGAWTGIDEPAFYNCADSISTGGTCSFEVDGKMVYYKYNDEEFWVNGKMVDSGWVKASYDPELGFCPMYYSLSSSYNLPKLLDSGYYYCWAGQWEKVNLVPKQYTDPRKEGLTDEEYDVLDLPKDAKVGDRAGGLLEKCEYNQDLYTVNGWEVYDYCISQNYYRYHEDGSWAIETTDEFFDDINSSSFECNAETEGQQRIRMPDEDQPGVVLQCVAVDNGTIEYEEVIVEYIFNQYEKK